MRPCKRTRSDLGKKLNMKSHLRKWSLVIAVIEKGMTSLDILCQAIQGAQS